MLLKELTQCFGVSGYEEKIAQLIMDNIKDKVDEVMIDSMGTIIALKKGNGENKKKDNDSQPYGRNWIFCIKYH